MSPITSSSGLAARRIAASWPVVGRGGHGRATPVALAHAMRGISTARAQASLFTASSHASSPAISSPRSVRPGHRTYASPAGSKPDANAGATAELRDSIISELDTLNARLLSLGPDQTSASGWLMPLTRAETDFVNMGQVPCPEGCEVLALLDLSTGPGAIKHPGVGPEGKGVHVPLLAMVGSTEPAVPCYPMENLFGGASDSVAGKVRGLVDAQRKAQNQGEGESVAQGMEEIRRDSGVDLIALMVPPDGKRDLGLPLALALYRLAMAEGNGYVGE